MRATLATFAAAATLVHASAVAQNIKWDMPTAYPAGNFHTANVLIFAKDVERASGGKLTITVHDNGSLFKAPEIKRAVQSGQAQIGEVLISNFSNENPLFGIDSIPFLATSYGEARRLWQTSRPSIEAALDKQGLKVLYAVPWPPQGIFSAKPIESAADLRGAKWRAYNPNTSRIAQLVGAQPVTIQAAELTQALATGAVNAFMTSGATGYDSKVWEQVKYYYDVAAWLPKNVVFVSKRAFDALDRPTQQALLKSAAEAEARGWRESEEKTAWYLEQLSKNGMTVGKGSPQLQADLRKVGETMIEEWTRQAGPEGAAVLATYRK